MLTPRQNDLLRQLVSDRLEAMAQKLPAFPTLQDDPEIFESMKALSELVSTLSEAPMPDEHSGGAPENCSMAFSPEELADIQRYAMFGMAATERSLMDNSPVVPDPMGNVKDRKTLQKDLNQFRATFGKLTLAFLSGSGAAEINKRQKE